VLPGIEVPIIFSGAEEAELVLASTVILVPSPIIFCLTALGIMQLPESGVIVETPRYEP
jgi:hypothetical protein